MGMKNERRLIWAMTLTGGFAIVEAFGGYLSGSLALLADAGHMFADTAALVVAWLALRIARRPADAKRTFGYHRAEVMAAFLNGAALLALSVWIVIEAGRRLMAPVEVLGGAMLVIAVLGLLVNLIALAILRGSHEANLNMQGARVHILGDLFSSGAAITAAGTIVWTGWTMIDPLLSVFVALIIFRSAWGVVGRSGHILLEGAPEGLDRTRVSAAVMNEVALVQDIHHLHAWSLTPGRTLVTMHACVDESADPGEVLNRIKGLLSDQFGVVHATIQLDTGRCDDGHGDTCQTAGLIDGSGQAIPLLGAACPLCGPHGGRDNLTENM